MTNWLAAIFLVTGALICLLASIGVLRLPDFFLRMHAATKAGVAGCGLILIGVGFAEPSFGLWIKVTIAIAFLLLTTPIAGHLLGRAGYVAGVPLWSGTSEDQLSRELRRGDFDQAASSIAVASPAGSVPPTLRQIVLCLVNGPAIEPTIRHAVMLAKTHRVELVGLAIVDTKMLENVGPVPIGGNYYATQLRHTLIGNARRAVAQVVQLFEQTAADSAVRFSVQVAEGDPIPILRSRQQDDALLIVGRDAWFDQGVSKKRMDPITRLTRHGLRPVIVIAGPVPEVRRVGFLHDGSQQSNHTWHWLLNLDPWPKAELYLEGDPTVSVPVLAKARAQASDRGRRVDGPETAHPARGFADCEVLVLGNKSRTGWLQRREPSSRPPWNRVSLIVFG